MTPASIRAWAIKALVWFVGFDLHEYMKIERNITEAVPE